MFFIIVEKSLRVKSMTILFFAQNYKKNMIGCTLSSSYLWFFAQAINKERKNVGQFY